MSNEDEEDYKIMSGAMFGSCVHFVEIKINKCYINTGESVIPRYIAQTNDYLSVAYSNLSAVLLFDYKKLVENAHNHK